MKLCCSLTWHISQQNALLLSGFVAANSNVDEEQREDFYWAILRFHIANNLSKLYVNLSLIYVTMSTRFQMFSYKASHCCVSCLIENTIRLKFVFYVKHSASEQLWEPSFLEVKKIWGILIFRIAKGIFDRELAKEGKFVFELERILSVRENLEIRWEKETRIVARHCLLMIKIFDNFSAVTSSPIDSHLISTFAKKKKVETKRCQIWMLNSLPFYYFFSIVYLRPLRLWIAANVFSSQFVK